MQRERSQSKILKLSAQQSANIVMTKEKISAVIYGRGTSFFIARKIEDGVGRIIL